MAVTRDIVEAHLRPRRVMARLLRMGQREDRVLAMLMGGCIILFVSQWPYRARQAHLTGETLTDYIQHDAVGLIFVLPLLAYGVAALLRLISRIFGAKANYYSARLAMFWALLASSPALVLAGMVKGFIGLGAANSIVGALWLLLFLWVLGNSLIEAEQ
ncbi:YIP1 family protein [uncultured Planktomarina sp.]|uniref:YIP1 family protein n=1 Tax=uncultured Planktomarina sp. TaxID=1538529 RepID=UPI00325FF410